MTLRHYVRVMLLCAAHYGARTGLLMWLDPPQRRR
jgi:hypothetical protein